MPKTGTNCSKISECLEILEDTTLYTKKSRTKCFECLKTIFDEDDGTVTPPEVLRILTVSLNCIKDDIQCFPHAVTAVSSLLRNVKVIPSISVEDLLPSALCLLCTFKTLCESSNTEKLKELSFEVFLSYPVNVLSKIITSNCSEVLEIFQVFKSSMPSDVALCKETCVFLHKLLLLLPPAEKNHFVKEGVAIWFGGFVPSVMVLVTKNTIEHNLFYLECLEVLTEALIDVDYSQCPQWQFEVLECICNSQKFPLLIKSQLQRGSNIWHRLWIVFVKILKNQITRNFGCYGTPINSMLPVVEMAFKMDVTNRCRAFQCWDNLIDNFSNETNVHCLPKRIKLLLIPLKLNNAKTEETALAKFNCWWNLIRKFQLKLDKFTNEILIGFMHFAFGKEASEKKPALTGASLSYDSVKNRSLQAFAEIVGHQNCDCYTDLPKLNRKLLNNKLLASNWSDWMYGFKIAIKITYTIYKKCNGTLAKQPMQILCVWRAFVVTIAELPPNGVRRDMFNELIQVLLDLAENCNTTDTLPDILFSMMLSLSEDNVNVRNVLLTSKDEQPLHKIMKIIINPGMHAIYERYDTAKMVEMLKPLTNLIVESMTIDWLLDNFPSNDSSLKLWTALMHSVNESPIDICPNILSRLLLWPVNAMQNINVDKYAATAWCTTYNLNLKKISNTGLEKYILESLTTQDEKNNTIYFKLCLTMCLLKNKLVNQEDPDVLPVILQNFTAQMNDYKVYEQAVPVLVDTIIVLLNNVTISENETLAKEALNCVKNLLTMITSEIKAHENEADNPIDANIFIMLNNIFKSVDHLYKIALYSNANCDLVDALTKHASTLSKESALFKFIMTKMGSLLMNCTTDTVKNKISDSIEMLKENQNKMNSHISSDTSEFVKEFTSPDVKKVVRRSKKKEATIVDKVVENGEEYVVVKSNWKFNPKKLTENQKEKFQRKRDIPALYQDLSQSQDEFKLSNWKTDSQDTTSSNSKSSKLTTNEDTSSILKNMPSSDVLPNIMENILAQNEKNQPSEPKAINIKMTMCNLPTDKPKMERLSLSTPKGVKSPRMALKDRVFRNVRNLIEKSSPINDAKEKVDEYQLETVPTTPTTIPINNANIINSAPPLISADRPSRVKRIPKKFDDVHFLTLKKKRSGSYTELQNEIDMIVMNESQNDNIDDFLNTDKASVHIDNNVVNNQEIVKQSDGTEIKEIKSVQVTSESEVTVLSETQTTINVLDEPITEDILYNNQKNDDIKHVEKNVVAQDDQKNENVEKANENNVTVVLNSEIVNNNNKSANEIVTLETPVKKTKEASQKSTTKSTAKKPRIEKQLAIDTVEGHPYLKSEKRSTRKKIELERTNKKNVLDEPITEDILYNNQKNDDIKHVEKNVVAQDDQKNKNVEKANENNVTVVLNSEIENNNNKSANEIVTLETPVKKTKEASQKSTTKKSTAKKPRIEKQLAIDTVEGHPYLKSEKRSTGKKIELERTNKRKSVTEKLNKIKSKISPKSDKKSKERDKLTSNNQESTSVTVEETQERNSLEDASTNENAPCSEDVIESSQDSTFTTISVKSTKRTPKRLPIVSVVRIKNLPQFKDIRTQDLLQESDCEMLSVTNKSVNQDTKDDTELPQNKTADIDKNQLERTENMDTEPLEEDKMSDDIIVINDDESPITISSENIVGPETQELAEADTQPNNPADFVEFEPNDTSPKKSEIAMDVTESISINKNDSISTLKNDEGDVIEIATKANESLTNCTVENTDISSPFKDDAQRKQDFLNNTSEISPIKVQSPDKEKTSSPQVGEDTSSDYLVVKLSSPVQSNGEPFDKCRSPEFFTEDKISPDKRDQSPPRTEVSNSSGSPSSSLSLKKNRPQALRPNGRAAHMLGLCVPDSLNTIKNSEKVESEEPKKVNTNTPARRNLRVLYNAVGENNDSLGENEEHGNFLKFKKTLPSTDSSPSVPILKRKLIDIVDDATASPASKRKRVSFHDPPVSTTVSVQKYIEPGCIKSPSSAHKRLERQMTRTITKSPKRLENAFVKLDTVLSNAVESFIEEQANSLTNDTNTSLDVTPAVEVVNTSELNDTDPICPDLVDCKDPIENIATELSSPAMKDLLIKELEGKVGTVGDLAKMSELDVNRLCIKAPKVQIAKKALADYVNKRVINADDKIVPEAVILADDTALTSDMLEEIIEKEPKTACVETQTNKVAVSHTAIQTRNETVKLASTQTNIVTVVHNGMQTVESGCKTTSDVISSCLAERGDFIDKLGEHLEESSVRKIAERLPTDTIIDILVNKSNDCTIKLILNKMLDSKNQDVSIDERNSMELSVLKDFVCDRFDGRDLILFCSQLLQKVYDKPA